MTIREIVTQGLHYARTCKSLWLFGCFVGIAGGGSGGSSGGGTGSGTGGGGVPFGLPLPAVALVALLIILAIVAVVLMRFVSEGALIEGVVRARQGGRMTTREGFRKGWAHWGVLLRIALCYVAGVVGILVLLAVPCLIAARALGRIGGIAFGVPALLIAVPSFVTLYLVQAFASRIAVLENRRAIDAIAKARLFLHGRLRHGLKLVVATFTGTLIIAVLGLGAIVPVALSGAALIPLLGLFPVIVLGCVILLPVFYVLAAVLGTFRSSVWTIGYLTQLDS